MLTTRPRNDDERFIGIVDLTGPGLGKLDTLTYSLPSDVVAALVAIHTDCTSTFT